MPALYLRALLSRDLVALFQYLYYTALPSRAGPPINLVFVMLLTVS